MSLLDASHRDCLGKVALTRARWTQEQTVLVLLDKTPRRKFEYQGPIRLLVEVEIEVVEGLTAVAKLGLFDATLEKTVLRRVSSSLTMMLSESSGASFSLCACRSRNSRLSAMPESRSCVRARFISVMFMLRFLLFFG